MLNPEYVAKVSDKIIPCDAGPLILCPKCKKPLMNATAEKLLVRCKHCRKWVFLQKKT